MRRAPDRVVMIGTDPGTHGGISAALNTWEAAGLFASWPVTYISTHCDGTKARKLGRAIAALARFTWLLLRVRCAILHVHGASRASFWRKAPFMALALAARWPVVYHLHGGGFARFYQVECGWLGKAIIRGLLERAACVLVVSEVWVTWVRTVVSHDRVACVPNAVVTRDARQAFPATQRVAFLGRLIEDKGVFELLEAFALVHARHPGASLDLAGDGDAAAVMRRARALGVASQVRVLGWCDEAARDELLAGAAVLALPSHFEGAPMSLLEAMAAEVPVVASRAGGIPDIVRDGENGLLFPSGDIPALAAALDRVLADPGLAQRLARAGRATVERDHSPQAAVDTIGRIYSNLGQRPFFRPLAQLHRHPACT